jgi:SAM-dependent MidA family methyltransferase
MEMALYDPEGGYYNSEGEKIGAKGDYYTSANLSQIFGSLLAKQFFEIYQEQIIDRLRIIELGAGTGLLALDILSTLENDYSLTEIDYLIVEPSQVLRKKQKSRLEKFKNRVDWVDLEELVKKPTEAIFLANEVIDALPVHRACWQKGKLKELYVSNTETSFASVWDEPSTKEILQFLKRFDIVLADQQVIEINFDAIKLLQKISQALTNGYVFIIDYGDLNDHLYLPERKDGTLRCFYKHRVNSDPFSSVGEQDITSDVDFSALIDYGLEFGLESIRFTRQADYLIKLGLLDKLEELLKDSSQDLKSFKSRLVLKNFFVPGGISDHFKVLIQKKVKKD